MIQGRVQDIVRIRNLADLETPDGFLNILGVGLPGFAGRAHTVRPQRLVKYLNNCWDRNIGHLLKQSLQIVGKGFGFLRV